MNRLLYVTCGLGVLCIPGAWGSSPPAFDLDLCANIAWGPAQHTEVICAADGSHEVVLDSRIHPGEVGGVSGLLPVERGGSYRVSGRVKRIRGNGRYKLAVEWFDEQSRHISYDNSWTGQLVGLEWEDHYADMPAPENARFVAVHAGIEPGNACSFSQIVLGRSPKPVAVPPAGLLNRQRHSADRGPSAVAPVPASSVELPPPQPVKTGITLGCYYFPVMLDWDRNGWGVRKVDYLEPLLGYYDETLPEVADWHIRWAVEHGVRFFVFDWYYNQGMLYLNDALEKGFLQSRHADRMKFCLDWCNEGQCTEYKPLDFSHQSLEGFIRTVCERYFAHPSYLTVEGRPVVLIHQAWRIINDHNGWAGCRDALDRMREISRTYGHAGVYFVAVHNNPCVLRYAEGGFDAVTSYGYGFCDVPWAPDRSLPYEKVVPRYERAMAEARRRTSEQQLDFIPTGWLGWDDAPRSRERAVRTSGNTPDAVRPMVEMLPRYVDNPLRLALLEAWNEWGEGGAAEPGKQYGFGYLDVVHSVLAPDSVRQTIFVPTPEDIRRFQTDLTFDQINDDYYRRYLRTLDITGGFSMAFDDRHGLWLRPHSRVMDVRIEDGALRCTAIGGDPVLLGPPVLDLRADTVRAIGVTMSTSAGARARLFWSTNADRRFAGLRSVSIDLIADGRMHEYEIPLAGHAAWTGLIRQLRFDPADAPARIAIARFASLE